LFVRVELCPGDYVTISASRYPFANVMPPGRRSEDWVNSISRTLQWNSRQRQKAFNEWEGQTVEEGESIENQVTKKEEVTGVAGGSGSGGDNNEDYFNSQGSNSDRAKSG
jgi:hypothetical protein